MACGCRTFRGPRGRDEWTVGAGRTLVMGVVNLTPDSFFAASRAATVEGAVQAALGLAEQGADLLDVGGESTRPGATPVSEDEECARILPVIERLAAGTAVPISIDTMKAGVAEAAVAAGASLVNDITGGLGDPHMASTVSGLAVPVILGHIQGTPATMQNSPSYSHAISEITAALRGRVAAFVAAGVKRDAILIDPGIGFGKRPEDNAAILGGLRYFGSLDHPLVLGVSRKRFLGTFLEEAGLPDGGPDGRLEASLAAAVVAAERGAAVVRVHDVAATRRALAVVEGLGPEHRQ